MDAPSCDTLSDVEAFSNMQLIKSFGLLDVYGRKLRQLQNRQKTVSLKYKKFSVLTSSAMSLVGMIPVTISAATAAERVMEVSSLPKEEFLHDAQVQQMLQCGHCRVKLDQVEFSYTPELPVLKNVSMEANPGQIIGIVGASGTAESFAEACYVEKYTKTVNCRGADILVIDLHSHILPGVDDGVATMDEALEMAQMAVDCGVFHMVATPHYNYFGHTTVEQIRAAFARLQDGLEYEQIPLQLYLGMENIATEHLPVHLRQGSALTYPDSPWFFGGILSGAVPSPGECHFASVRPRGIFTCDCPCGAISGSSG